MGRRQNEIWPRAWRRKPATFAVMLLLAAVVAWGRLHVPLGGDQERYHNQTFACVKVVDGDTLDVDIPDGDKPHTRVRLWGVDTPETAQSRREAMYFGPEASAFTKSLVEGRRVRLVLTGRSRDKYGRLLAYVYLADRDLMLNEELLRTGHAYADRRFDHPWKERFMTLETAAARGSKGLWRRVKPEQMPEWRQRYDAWREGN